MCVCVCVCVTERQRWGQRQRDGDRDGDGDGDREKTDPGAQEHATRPPPGQGEQCLHRNALQAHIHWGTGSFSKPFESVVNQRLENQYWIN